MGSYLFNFFNSAHFLVLLALLTLWSFFWKVGSPTATLWKIVSSAVLYFVVLVNAALSFHTKKFIGESMDQGIFILEIFGALVTITYILIVISIEPRKKMSMKPIGIALIVYFLAGLAVWKSEFLVSLFPGIFAAFYY